MSDNDPTSVGFRIAPLPRIPEDDPVTVPPEALGLEPGSFVTPEGESASQQALNPDLSLETVDSRPGLDESHGTEFQSTASTTPQSEPVENAAMAFQRPERQVQQIPSDLVDLHGAAATTAIFKQQPSAFPKQPDAPKKVEPSQRQWENVLGDLPQTMLVHVTLYRRQQDGTFARLGTRYHMDINEVRQLDHLVPYGDGTQFPVKYMIAIAPSTARMDDERAWKKVIYERVGPAPPEGWSFDSWHNWVDSEVTDMATAREIAEQAVTQAMRDRNQGGGQQQGQQAPPGYGAPYGMPPYGMGYPQMPYGMMPPMMPYGVPQRGYAPMQYPMPYPAPDDGAARYERERLERERLDRERMDRELVERNRLDAERKDREAREEKARLETVAREEKLRIEHETRLKEEKDRFTREADAQKAQMEEFKRQLAVEREARERIDRERMELQHKSEMQTLSSKFDTLTAELTNLRNAPKAPESGFNQFLGQFAPTITEYFRSDRERALEERKMRLEESIRERERIGAEADRNAKWFEMITSNQMGSARMVSELLAKSQDAKPFMDLLQGSAAAQQQYMGMLMTIMRSGLVGGGQQSGIDWNGILGQGFEIAGKVLGDFAEVKAKQAELAAVQARNMVQAPVVMPPTGNEGPRQMQDATPVVEAPVAQAPQAGRPASNNPLQPMVDKLKNAFRSKADPEKVASMLAAVIQTADAFDITDQSPQLQQFLKAIMTEPRKTILMAFSGVNDPVYLNKVADAFIENYAPGEPSNEDEDEGDEAAGDAATGNVADSAAEAAPVTPPPVRVVPPARPMTPVAPAAPSAPPAPPVVLPPASSASGNGNGRGRRPQIVTMPSAITPEAAILNKAAAAIATEVAMQEAAEKVVRKRRSRKPVAEAVVETLAETVTETPVEAAPAATAAPAAPAAPKAPEEPLSDGPPVMTIVTTHVEGTTQPKEEALSSAAASAMAEQVRGSSQGFGPPPPHVPEETAT